MMKVKQKISGGFRTWQGAQIFCLPVRQTGKTISNCLFYLSKNTELIV